MKVVEETDVVVMVEEEGCVKEVLLSLNSATRHLQTCGQTSAGFGYRGKIFYCQALTTKFHARIIKFMKSSTN